MRRASERFPRDQRALSTSRVEIRHGGAFQRARNMPEEQIAGNGTRGRSEMSVAGFADRDGLSSGIDEPDTLAQFDLADRGDWQADDRGQIVDLLRRTGRCREQKLVVVAPWGERYSGVRLSIDDDPRRG